MLWNIFNPDEDKSCSSTWNWSVLLPETLEQILEQTLPVGKLDIWYLFIFFNEIEFRSKYILGPN